MADKIIIAVKEQVLRDLIIFTIQSEMFFNIIEVDDPVQVNVALMKNPDTVSVIYDDIFGVTGRKAVVDYMRDNRLEVPLYLLGKNNIEVMVPGIDGMHEVKPIQGDYLQVIMDGVKDYFEEDKSQSKREYVPITFRTLTRLKGLTEDVYIKLSEKKFLKIYRQQDKIDFSDVDKYSKKGVDTLYLDKETSKWLLKQLSKFVESLGKRIDHVKSLASKSPEIEKLLKSLEINRDTKNYFNTHNNLLSTVVCLIAR